MRNDQSIGLAARLMYHNKICKVVALADLDKVFQHIATTIDASCVRYNQLELLLENYEALARIAAGGDENLRVTELGLFVLIVDMGTGNHCVLVSEVEVIRHSCFLFPELSWNFPIVIKGVLHLEALILRLMLLQFLALLVDVVFAQTNVSLNHFWLVYTANFTK